MLMLKLVRDDMTSHGGFKWPENGFVAPDYWSESATCGDGLHGWAQGEGSYIHAHNEGKWLVVDTLDSPVIWIDGEKCKIAYGNVVYCGTREGAVGYLIAHHALTERSNPGLVCLTPSKCAEFAKRAAARATYAARAAANAAAYVASDAADAANDAANVAATTHSAARAAANAAYAANAANAAYAAYAANAANAADASDEREMQRRDKLELLNIINKA